MSGGLVLMLAVLLLAAPEAAAQFKNPIGISSVSELLVNIIRWLLGIGGLLVMLALVYGGIKFVVSLGNDKGVQEAKGIIKWAIIGLTALILSYVIITTVVYSILGVPRPN